MPQLVVGRDAEVAAWVAERIPHVTTFGVCAAIGVVSGDRLLAGMVYHDYQPACENVQLSMAADSPMWARRDVIAGLLHYPFHQMNCWMVWTATPPENEAALRVNKHVGLIRKTVVPHAFGRKKHAVICQMTLPEYNRLYGA